MNKIKSITKKPILIIALLSFVIMSVTLVFSTKKIDAIFLSYYRSFFLILLNYIPILLLMLLTYIISKNMIVSYYFTSFLYISFSFANHYKLTYRNDPFMFYDIFLAKEAFIMSKQYTYSLSIIKLIVLLIAFVVIPLIIYLLKVSKINIRKFTALKYSILIMITMVLLYSTVYSSAKIYNNIGDFSKVNKWIEVENFQVKGFVYPFIHSSTNYQTKKPDNYDKSKAQSILNSYDSKDIPKDKKVNIISIMLESYADFSVFDDLDFNIDIYKNLHEIYEESYHGTIVSSSYAGGTNIPEREFLTGLFLQPNYRGLTNSHIWYLKNQGYYTEALHPSYGSFYNRINVNKNLGFDEYYNIENRYDEIIYNDLFFKDIIQSYENSKKKDMPYFNFSITYRGHGPYPIEEKQVDYLKKKDSYNDTTYSIANSYFQTVYETDIELKKLIDYLRDDQEPVVLVVFGDHKPGLNDLYGLENLGINIDFDEPEGFHNVYSTPYFIWSNNKAKDVIQDVKIGKGKDLSCSFLMSEVFEYIGIKGNSYMQYITDVKQSYNVLTTNYIQKNGVYEKEYLTEHTDEYNNIFNVNYYYGKYFDPEQ